MATAEEVRALDPSTVMEVTQGFACEINGRSYVMVRGKDRVAAGHELVQKHPIYFKPISADMTYDIEEATDNPGEQRARRQPSKRPPAESVSETKSESPVEGEKAADS